MYEFTLMFDIFHVCIGKYHADSRTKHDVK